MARANRGHKFPYQSVDLGALPEDMLVAAHAWKWEKHDDPKRSRMRAFRVHTPELDEGGEKRLIPCGRLLQIRFRIPTTGEVDHGRTDRFELPSDVGQWTYLMFDNDDQRQPLYMIMDDRAKRHARTTLLNPNPFTMRPLKEVAQQTGGLQAKGWYPNVMVKPVGISTAIIYFATKSEDGSSNYIHRFGEESGIRPTLCVAQDGCLWFAGGDYTCPTAGITN
jgi:hypothetical protein